MSTLAPVAGNLNGHGWSGLGSVEGRRKGLLPIMSERVDICFS